MYLPTYSEHDSLIDWKSSLKKHLKLEMRIFFVSVYIFCIFIDTTVVMS